MRDSLGKLGVRECPTFQGRPFGINYLTRGEVGVGDGLVSGNSMRKVQFVAHACVDGHPRRDLPIICHIEMVQGLPGAKYPERLTGVGNSKKSQQEIGEGLAPSRSCPSRIERTGKSAVEGATAATCTSEKIIDTPVIIGKSELQQVFPFFDREVVADIVDR